MARGESFFGQTVNDPYRWLEDASSSTTRGWMDEQRRRSDAVAASYSTATVTALRERLTALSRRQDIGVPKIAGNRLFFTKTSADRQQPAYHCRSTTTIVEQVWLDPAAQWKDGSQSVGAYWPSPDGRSVAFTLRNRGADEATLHVRDIVRGRQDPKESIPGATFADVSWTPDGRGFYYFRLPADSKIPEAERVAQGDIRFHKLGAAAKDDPQVFPPTFDASRYLTPRVSRDGRWLFVITAFGWSGTDIVYQDREDPAKGFQPLFASSTSVASVIAWKDQFYLHTDQGAPTYCVKKRAPAETAWKVIVPARKDVVISAMHLFGERLVLLTTRGVESAIEIRSLSGKLERQLRMPVAGSIDELSGREEDRRFFFNFESYASPPAVYEAWVDHDMPKAWSAPAANVSNAPITVQEVRYRSRDGSRIPMTIVGGRRGSRAPALLHVYGGFNTAMQPRFHEGLLLWLERGGTLAVPHLRGGGEYGKTWHEAGLRERKQNTIDDTIAAAQYLIKEGYAARETLAIQGASNGGLIAAAALTQRPELFGAAVIKNPITDMIRYPLFGQGKAWVSEYGSPDVEAHFKALHAYSPYHRVVSSTTFPATLILAAEYDDRVDPLHARKFAAALQAAQAGPAPVIFQVLPNAGHAGATQRQALIDEWTARLAFLEEILGVRR